MALADHPFSNIDPASGADRNDALVAVAIDFGAARRPARIEKVSKGERRLLSASIFAALGV